MIRRHYLINELDNMVHAKRIGYVDEICKEASNILFNVDVFRIYVEKLPDKNRSFFHKEKLISEKDVLKALDELLNSEKPYMEYAHDYAVTDDDDGND